MEIYRGVCNSIKYMYKPVGIKFRLFIILISYTTKIFLLVPNVSIEWHTIQIFEYYNI